MRSSLAIALLALAPWVAGAQTPLNLEQTSAWIVKNLVDTAGLVTESYAHEYKDAKIEGCVLTFTDKQYAGPATSDLLIKVPLSAVAKVAKRSETEGRQQRYSLVLTTSGQPIEQSGEGLRRQDAPPARGNFLSIFFQRPDLNSADAVNRMADAINHMAELCRLSATANQ
jgi:hypothetical protein